MQDEFSRAAARFWARTESVGACLLWTGGGDGKGYGCFRFRGRTYRAHQFAWILRHGPIPDRLCVLHRCDVRLCLADAHHFLGTRADNIADMIAKGRGRFAHPGEMHHAAKLGEDDVREIRRLHAEGMTYADLGRLYGVDWTVARNADISVTWRHVR